MNDNKLSEITLKNLEPPFYLIDEKVLSNNVNDLKAALEANWNNYLIGYSFKTNALPWLINDFKDRGFYAEVVSDDEYALAQLIGYRNDRIIYNGPAKSKETFLEAIRNGCIVNLDAQRELDWLEELKIISGQKYQVGIRVNFDLEKYCPGESAMGVEGGRFGFCYENGQLKKVLDRIVKMDHVDLCGIHLHCSSKSRSLNIYRTIAKIACEIKMAYGLNLQYVDVGGGFFGGLANKPTFKDYLSVIAEELEKAFDKEQTKLIVEPGTSLVSSPFSFITSVIDVKETTQNRFVVTDGSRNDVDPLRHKKSYFYRIEAKKEKKIDKQVICGYTCMEDDRLFEIRDGQELSVGDRIIYEKVGAYTMCLSALFIKYFPPVYLNKGNQIHCVREKWTAADFLMQSNSEI